MPASEAPAVRRSGPADWQVIAGFTVLASLPALVSLVVLASKHWYPTGDMAQAELHLRGIWQHLPLVGAAGRITGDTGIQGSHPGPSLWFAMYPVYALLGRTSFGAMAAVSAASVNAFMLFWARFGSGLGPASEFPLGQAIVSVDFAPPSIQLSQTTDCQGITHSTLPLVGGAPPFTYMNNVRLLVQGMCATMQCQSTADRAASSA